jgi:hypothetical protein
MWYHYISLVVGLYLTGSAIYSMVMVPGTMYSRWISNGIYAVIGVAIAWWSWAGITAPPPMMLPMAGGRRSRRY